MALADGKVRYREIKTTDTIRAAILTCAEKVISRLNLPHGTKN